MIIKFNIRNRRYFFDLNNFVLCLLFIYGSAFVGFMAFTPNNMTYTERVRDTFDFDITDYVLFLIITWCCAVASGRSERHQK